MNRDLLERDLDAAGKRISNLLLPVLGTEPMRLQDVTVGAGILKSTGVNQAPLVLAEAGVDYQDFIVAGNGIRIPDGKTINNTLVEGLDDGQVVIGGQSIHGALYLTSTSHPTKGAIYIGDPTRTIGFIDEDTKTWAIGGVLGPATATLHVAGVSTGEHTSASFHDNLGNGSVTVSHPSSSIARMTAYTGVALKLGSNNVADRIVLDTAGHVTFADLAGSGTALTRVTAAGLFERAVANTDFPALNATYWVSSSTNAPPSAVNLGALSTGLVKITVTGSVATPSTASNVTDYQVPIAAGNGIRLSGSPVNTINSTLVEGKAGGQTVIGGTAGSENLSFSTTTNVTKGLFVFGSTSIASLNEATGNMAVGAAYSSGLGGRFQAIATTAGQSAAFSDGTTSAIKISHPSSTSAAIVAPSTVALGLGAGGTTWTTWSTAGLLTHGGDVALNASGTTGVSKTGGALVVGTDGSDSLIFKTGATPRLTIDSAGVLTASSLAGSGSALVKVSNTGVLSRGVAGSDYLAAPSFTAGSVIFSGGNGSGGAGGILLEDNTNLFFNDSTNVLSVGVNSTISGSVMKSPDGATGTPGLAVGIAGTGFWRQPSQGGRIVVAVGGTDLIYVGGPAGTSSDIQLDTITFSFGAGDIVLQREAQGFLAQRLSSIKQGFAVYNTWTSTTNYERGVLDWTTTANILTIGAQAGSGGGTLRQVQMVGTFVQVPAGTTTNPGLAIGANNVGWHKDSSGRIVFVGAGAPLVYLGGAAGNAGDVQTDTVTFGVGSTDTVLQRSAAGTLELRSGTQRQIFRLYQTYSSAGANYERFSIAHNTTEVAVSTEAAGTGSLQWIRVVGKGLNLQGSFGQFASPTVVGIGLNSTMAAGASAAWDGFSIPASTLTITGSTTTNTLATGVNAVVIGPAHLNSGGTTQTVNQSATLVLGGASIGENGTTIVNAYNLWAQTTGKNRLDGPLLLGQPASGARFEAKSSNNLELQSNDGATRLWNFNAPALISTTYGLIRWGNSQTPTAAGDLGMDTTTGRPQAFIGSASRALAALSDVPTMHLQFEDEFVQGTWFGGAQVYMGHPQIQHTGAIEFPYPHPLNATRCRIQVYVRSNSLNGTLFIFLSVDGSNTTFLNYTAGETGNKGVDITFGVDMSPSSLVRGTNRVGVSLGDSGDGITSGTINISVIVQMFAA